MSSILYISSILSSFWNTTFQSALLTNSLSCLDICFLFISNVVNLDILPFFWLFWLMMCIVHSFIFKEQTLHHFYSFILFILLLYILLVSALDLIVPLPAFVCLPPFSKDFKMHYYLLVISLVLYYKHRDYKLLRTTFALL